jgi:hypothetical protein
MFRVTVILSNSLIFLATPTGFEPVTPRLGIWCSIHLSYGAVIGTDGFAHHFARSIVAALTSWLRAFLAWLLAGSEADTPIRGSPSQK